ncbi:hypothetical protein FOE78_21475 [Microlunatus elymi]|uniref:VOC domain-containing protein n=1 Tax=Microlunatus elymi TaxID=2596828 RepID=A0A516Q3W8_9ACTN|nr:hypothetical protein [Microlunatus elymi]QDP98127.1 hypothetical protein FOE78_21475 [Microlunatus elymi]
MITNQGRTGSARVTQTLEVSAFRFSADPTALVDFLSLLGLSVRVSNSAGNWYELQGAAGSISIHGAGELGGTTAEPGTTDVIVITPDLIALAEQLRADGNISVDVWDEAFGRQATMTVGERTISINEQQSDPYGYQVSDPKPGPVTVVGHCYTDDVETTRSAFAELGFAAVDPAGGPDDRIRLQASESSGVICLHPIVGGPDRYLVGLEIEQDLDAVDELLRSAGFATRHVDTGESGIEVTDPDGQPLLITAR